MEGFAKGNVPAAIKITLIGLLTDSILTPFYVKGLLGAEIPVQIVTVFQQILLFIVVPLIAGQITRIALIKKHGQKHFQKKHRP